MENTPSKETEKRKISPEDDEQPPKVPRLEAVTVPEHGRVVVATSSRGKETTTKPFDIVLARAQYMFPVFDGSVMGPRKSVERIQLFLFDYVRRKVRHLPEQERQRLMKRENAKEFCLEIGMNQSVVDLRFRVIQSIEQELGIVGKTPILDSIFHFIENIDADKIPVGNEEEDVGNGEYGGREWLSYMGVKPQKGGLKTCVATVADALEEKASEGTKSVDEYFMHGTTSSVLGQVWDRNGQLTYNDSIRHDFGPGFYCF